MIEPPRAVIFDWDNTLVDSWDAIAEAINHARKQFGLTIWSLDEIKANCTRAARDSFPEWFGDKWEAAYKVYYDGFDEIRKKRSIKILPGALELLQLLKANNIPAFVVSNKRGDYLRIEVEKVKWGSFFVSVVGASDAPKDKPCREHVDYALKDAGFKADAFVWFVGDSETDMICARNSDCTPVFIGSQKEADKLGVKLAFSDCQAMQTLLYNQLQAAPAKKGA